MDDDLSRQRSLALIRLAAGPGAFLLAYLFGSAELGRETAIVLATFVWCVVWWISQPIPWAITALLPMVVFPVLGVMGATETFALYGQNILFWVLGMAMFARAMAKHGLAKRFALRILCVRGVATTNYRLTFVFMLATALVSMFVSDAAAVAIMLPIGVSIVVFLGQAESQSGDASSNPLASFLALGALCAAEAGGLATIAGLPHNALAVSINASLSGRTIGWFEWMMVGVPLLLIVLVSYYVILRAFFPIERSALEGGLEIIERERAALGRPTRGELNVVIVFVLMAVLFTLPPLLGFLIGADHPLSLRLSAAVPIWVVPPLVALLLFLLPVDLRKGEGTLTLKDFSEHAPWNVMLLCTGAVAMTNALAQLGFMDIVASEIGELGVGVAMLPFLTALVTGLSTNIVSGVAATSILCSLLIPVAQDVGFNTASMAMLIPNNALGIMFPWAGAAAATAFATGYLDLKQMMKVGAVATLVLALLTASVHMLFAPLL